MQPFKFREYDYPDKNTKCKYMHIYRWHGCVIYLFFGLFVFEPFSDGIR